MRKIIYQCDNCEKVFGEQTHLSIVFARYSGWVTQKSKWHHVKTQTGIRQFCNGQCLGKYFNKIKPK